MDLLLDTCVLIDHLSGDAAATAVLRRGLDGDSLFVSAVTVIEIFQKSDLTPDEQARRKALLDGLEILPITGQIAIDASLVASDMRNHAPAGIVFDALIAETARSHGMTLVSRNVGDFTALRMPPEAY